MALTRKQEFLVEYELLSDTIEWLIVAVRLPDGKVELITNQYRNIAEKVQYYSMAYNDDLVLNTNINIRIVNWMFA